MEEIDKEYLKKQILKQEKLASIGALSAGIAHEVQNPLNFVINFSRMSASLISDLKDITEANRDKLGDDTADEIKEITNDLTGNIEKIIEHGIRSLDIIHSILLQSRGKNEEFLPTDIQSLIHEYVWLSYHASRAEDRTFNIAISENYSDGMPKMMVVPQDLSRALVNCLNNSFYAVKERVGTGEAGYSPKVSVTVAYTGISHRDGKLSVNITDNGVGMPPEIKDKIYENFFTTKPAGKGTGLGMGIIRHIIEEEHHGQILLDSIPNSGTSITFIIPVQIIR